MRKAYYRAFFASVGMLALILDSRTAVSGAWEGLELCIRTVIPSLFPFIFLTNVLTGSLAGTSHRYLKPIGRLLKIPEGSESLFLAGILGGYPTGAACICTAWKGGQLSKAQAERLLGFCNNAGPAFLFGMAGSLFSNYAAPWILWGIHIGSALAASCLLPSGDTHAGTPLSSIPVTFTGAARRALYIMSSVCSWVVLFRILICFCSRWFLWQLPKTVQIILFGALELSNGCCALSQLSSESLRFILLSGFIAFGGICVIMQTCDVTNGLSRGYFYSGKLLQCILSILFSMAVVPFLFPEESLIPANASVTFMFLLAFIAAVLWKLKKTVAFPKNLIYNGRNRV